VHSDESVCRDRASHLRPDDANQRQERRNEGNSTALEAARRADTDHRAHEQPEIEGAGMDQQSFSNVRVPAEMHAAHPAGFIEMGKRSFQALPAEPRPRRRRAPRIRRRLRYTASRAAGFFFQFRRPRSGSET